ncbi:nucleoside phosphorylase [Natranaerobius trueperi]|uniref:Uridine phosphorylase n=1 Tax=Natranaerobius trueperi TaxID=759412 RepID=A0A226BW91_9FIRM|nr:nucleoside phosphorylase [Natranaerobius trueperi]OWZ83171.1 purine phosphorylase [Natranaerobius trueperi]
MNKKTTDVQKHIRCREGDVNQYVLLPGDPARAKRIADCMDEATKVAENREYVIYNGYYDGQPVSVCSTGIGGPSAAIAIEELAKVGAHTFIRVGSAGARRSDIPIGSVVVVNSAVRGDGTSTEYLPMSYPAVANFDVTNELVDTSKELNEQCFVGASYTRDAFYMQNEELNDLLLDTDVVVSEMECSTLFIVGSKRRLRVGAVVGTDSNIILKQGYSLEEKERLYYQAEKKAITVALKGAANMSAKEN